MLNSQLTFTIEAINPLGTTSTVSFQVLADQLHIIVYNKRGLWVDAVWGTKQAKGRDILKELPQRLIWCHLVPGRNLWEVGRRGIDGGERNHHVVCMVLTSLCVVSI